MNFSLHNAQKYFEHRKLKGSGLLVMALVGAAVVGVTSLSLAKANSIAINSMGSHKIAMQAQQYAVARGELVRATNYSELASQGKTNIGSTGFQDEVVVSGESVVDATTKKKEVTIRIYKSGEANPRSSIVVTRYNKSIDSSIPSGSIIPWYGNIANIPSGFLLCNGANGTPDLRDKFLVGAGNSYGIGATGGATHVQLSLNEMPSHAHTRGTMNITGYLGLSRSFYDGASGAFYINGQRCKGETDAHAWISYNNAYFDASRAWTGETSWAGSSVAHENRPPFYALYYIMKV